MIIVRGDKEMKKILKKLQITLTLSCLFGFLCVIAWSLCLYLVPSFKYYDIIAIVFMVLFISFYTILISSYTIKISSIKNKTDLSVSEILDSDVLECYKFGQIGTIIFDEEKKIIWENDYLQNIGIHLVEHPIKEISEELEKIIDDENDSVTTQVQYENKTFLIKLIKDARLFILKNITESENERKIFSEEALVIGHLQIDNYSDLSTSMKETDFTIKVSELQRELINFAGNYRFYISMIKSDTYFLLGSRKDFDRMQADNFNIVDHIRNGFGGFTISIGLAYGYPGIPVMAQESREALDVALSRGGDQVVVSPCNQNLQYFGGKSESKSSGNRTQLRTHAKSLATAIRKASNVLICGHYNADFDAIGSCIGVYRICKTLKIPAKILYDSANVESSCKHAFSKIYSSGQIGMMTVNYNEAMALIKPDTLLICVDVNEPSRMIFPNFIDDDNNMNVGVIDHHRRGSSQFKNVVFNGSDSSASSACELVAEYISMSEYKIELSKEEATFMLAGTMLDTNYFRNKVSEGTFDAMIVLKRFGADSLMADDFLKEDYERYTMKTKFLNNMKTPFTGIIVTKDPNENELVDQSVLAMVSQECMTISGIDAAFSIGRISQTEVGISARSGDQFNVQFIMEKMGGGGHHSAAAASISSTSPTEVADDLYNKLNDYISLAKDSKNNKNTQTLIDLKPVGGK